MPTRVYPTFRVKRPIVGMVHLRALPGAPRYSGSFDEVLGAARSDATALTDAGVDGLLVENFGDAPFFAGRVPPETVAAMSVLVAELRRACPLPVGVNVLRNDARAALAIAAATGALFVRINVHTGAMLTDQGWIRGRAAATLRRRAALRIPCAIFADVGVKHAVAPACFGLAQASRDSWQRGLADALIVSGAETGDPVRTERLETVRRAAPDAPLWIGSGLDFDNVGALLVRADGAIVGSALSRDGAAGSGIDPDRARRFMDAVRDVDAERTG